jgi:hypothetical protein
MVEKGWNATGCDEHGYPVPQHEGLWVIDLKVIPVDKRDCKWTEGSSALKSPQHSLKVLVGHRLTSRYLLESTLSYSTPPPRPLQ